MRCERGGRRRKGRGGGGGRARGREKARREEKKGKRRKRGGEKETSELILSSPRSYPKLGNQNFKITYFFKIFILNFKNLKSATFFKNFARCERGGRRRKGRGGGKGRARGREKARGEEKRGKGGREEEKKRLLRSFCHHLDLTQNRETIFFKITENF